MNVIRTEIEDVLILEPRVFGDDRGFFYESFNQSAFEHILGYPVSFVQDNHSRSSKNVLRGLHFQRGEYAQDKLVRCTHGAVFDVAVDIRPNSVSFGKWVGVLLSADNKQQLWIPKGFAHGFWFCLISLNFNIKLQTIIILKAIVEYVGMMNALQLIGPKHQG